MPIKKPKSAKKTMKLVVYCLAAVSILHGSHKVHASWPPSDVSCIATSSDGKFVAAGRSDATIDIWRTKDHSVVAHVAAYGQSTSRISSVVFSRSGDILTTESVDHSVREFNVTAKKFVRTIKPGAANGHSFEQLHLNGNQAKYDGFETAPNGETVALSTSTGLSLIDLRKHTVIATAHGAMLCPHPPSFSADGNRFVCAAFNDDLRTQPRFRILLWNKSKPTQFVNLGRCPGWPSEFALSPDGRKLAVSDTNSNISIYLIAGDGASMHELYTMKHGDRSYRTMCLKFSPRSDSLYIGTREGTVELWTLDDDSWSELVKYGTAANFGQVVHSAAFTMARHTGAAAPRP